MRKYRWIAAACPLSAAASMVVMAVVGSLRDPTGREISPSPPPSALARGIETTIYGPALRAKFSAESVEITTPKILGPFRLGIYRRLLARDVEVHLFAEGGEATTQFAASEVANSLVPTIRRYAAKGAASVEMTPLRVFEHRGRQSELLLRARACRADAGRLLCWDGELSAAQGATPFRRASFDGRDWKLETSEPDD